MCPRVNKHLTLSSWHAPPARAAAWRSELIPGFRFLLDFEWRTGFKPVPAHHHPCPPPAVSCPAMCADASHVDQFRSSRFSAACGTERRRSAQKLRSWLKPTEARSVSSIPRWVPRPNDNKSSAVLATQSWKQHWSRRTRVESGKSNWSCDATRDCGVGRGDRGPGLTDPDPGGTRTECPVVLCKMPGCSSTRVPGRVLWLQHQCSPLRADDLHGMETQPPGESDEAEVVHVPSGERESLHHPAGFQNQTGSTSLGKHCLAACHAHSLLFSSPATWDGLIWVASQLLGITVMDSGVYGPRAYCLFRSFRLTYASCFLTTHTRFPPGSIFRHFLCAVPGELVWQAASQECGFKCQMWTSGGKVERTTPASTRGLADRGQRVYILVKI